jgi:hypothetical protein
MAAEAGHAAARSGGDGELGGHAMKRLLPLFVLGVGILLVFGGIIYDILYAGIPYQDPTPEMSARYAYHSHIASNYYKIGGVTLLLGVTACATQFVVYRFSKRRAS